MGHYTRALCGQINVVAWQVGDLLSGVRSEFPVLCVTYFY